MLMQHNLLPKHKHRKNGLNVNIDLYELATVKNVCNKN